MKKAKEAGQSIVEYALLIAAVALLAMPAVWYLGRQMEALFSKTAQQMEEAPPSAPTVP